MIINSKIISQISRDLYALKKNQKNIEKFLLKLERNVNNSEKTKQLVFDLALEYPEVRCFGTLALMDKKDKDSIIATMTENKEQKDFFKYIFSFIDNDYFYKAFCHVLPASFSIFDQNSSKDFTGKITKDIWKKIAAERLKTSISFIKNSNSKIYSTVAAISFFPIVNSATKNNFIPVIMLLGDVFGGSRTELASQLDKWNKENIQISEKNLISWIENNVVINTDLRDEIDIVIEKFDLFSIILNSLNLKQTSGFYQKLKEELINIGNYERFQNFFCHTKNNYLHDESNNKGNNNLTIYNKDFNDEKIMEFLKKWTKNVEYSSNLNQDLTDKKAYKEEQKLLKSLDRNERIKKLASNPLLLTILVLMKRHGITFQEYFAASVAQSGEIDISPVLYQLLEYIEDPACSELIRLFVAYIGIIQGREESASKLLIDLIKKSKYKAINLAGNVLIDAWPGGLTINCKEKIIDFLIRSIRDEFNSSPKYRSESGNILAQSGDIRKDVMTIDNMHFCYIPKGDFWMGEEEEIHLVNIKTPYFIGKYPITNAQYMVFVECEGYAKKQYWKEACSLGKWNNAKYNGRNIPESSEYPENLSNHPVIRISWFEALAFTRWLTERWIEKGLITQDWYVTLPSEAEWEKAARGGREIPTNPFIVSASNNAKYLSMDYQLVRNKCEKRTYPWGNKWDINFVNSEETEILTTNTVGCFGKGISPYGCEDMCGNVWEWTRSIEKKYPYHSGDGRESINTPISKIIKRGGSNKDEEKFQHCATRQGQPPGYNYESSSFRCVICPNIDLS
ncbi:Sulphatase-modifying factor domain protein [Candidatus Magnetomorum sp. HK-1]|nr:Sulphatase-modifying factor domain protein [Candidatus Magnetomorum sp. HK-1]